MANHHPSPTMMQLQQRGAPQGPPPPSAAQGQRFPPVSAQLAAVAEAVWMQIGTLGVRATGIAAMSRFR
jgi:general transcriptional corepressor CYC8